jgi:16S rRNA (adenine1518-N6/adenine1519-N6)-dimethyltransferase
MPQASIKFPAARKQWGQHFLHDKGIIEKIMASVQPLDTDEFLEIGPGRGALTEALLAAGAKVHAIEIDPLLHEQLHKHFLGNNLLKLYHADALKFDYLQLPCAKLRVVANLPYNIGAPLLMRLLTLRPMPVDMHLMLQREVAARLYAQTNSASYGRLSVMTQVMCSDVSRALCVNPGSFVPAPEVRSEVVRLSPHKTPPTPAQQRALEILTRHAFGMRRKKLRHSLGKLIGEHIMVDLGIDPAQRPGEIEPQAYLRAACLCDKESIAL